MIFIMIIFIVVCVGTAVALLRSNKPVRDVLATAKYEFFYNIVGTKAMIEDFWMKGKNKTGNISLSFKLINIKTIK